MQTLLIAQSHESPAPAPGRSPVRTTAPFDALYETLGGGLYRVTFVVGPAWYVARLAKLPLAAHLAEALVAVIAALLLHWLAGHLLKRLHLLSDASFERPAAWHEDDAAADDRRAAATCS